MIDELPGRVRDIFENQRMAEINRLEKLRNRYRTLLAAANGGQELMDKDVTELAAAMKELGITHWKLADDVKLLKRGLAADQLQNERDQVVTQ